LVEAVAVGNRNDGIQIVAAANIVLGEVFACGNVKCSDVAEDIDFFGGNAPACLMVSDVTADSVEGEAIAVMACPTSEDASCVEVNGPKVSPAP
jgi:hypothetical protein